MYICIYILISILIAFDETPSVILEGCNFVKCTFITNSFLNKHYFTLLYFTLPNFVPRT